ncbi:bifunctional nicotinamidase/pyrazinamidase [Lichenihabitans psoromatis]|uniref:bifunctional nicotinamidase/pyrazinamidase n=1 Tax=Lichenihabitans psoromatis TaxID=2528642 RepID=UPI0010385339
MVRASQRRKTAAMIPIAPTDHDVLIVVDVQTDFLPGGALAVPDGDAVIPPINALIQRFAHVVLTQDWHTPGHISFASSHAGKTPFQMIELAYGDQVLWPDHCVQGTRGAALSDALEASKAELVIRKGFHPEVDSYSAFMEADRNTPTGLAGYFKSRGFTRVFVCGLATDYCVGWTAIDARAAGFDSLVIEDACRAIDSNGSLAKAWAAMAGGGVQRIMAEGVV